MSDNAEQASKQVLAFTVAQPDLLAALKFVEKSLPKRPGVPVLTGVVLASDGAIVTVETFDHDQARRVVLPGAESSCAGTALVAASKLMAMVKALPKDRRITLTGEGTRVRLFNGKTTYTVPTMPIEDYPARPIMPPTVGMIDASVLAAAAAHARKFAGTDETLPRLTGVRVSSEEARLSLEATDRYRLTMRDLEWANEVEKFAALVPAKLFAEATGALGKTVGAVATLGYEQTAPGSGWFGVETDYGRMITRTLDEGNYPPVRSLVPKRAVCEADVDVAELVAVIKRAEVALERSQPVILRFGDDAFTVQSGTEADGGASETVEDCTIHATAASERAAVMQAAVREAQSLARRKYQLQETTLRERQVAEAGAKAKAAFERAAAGLAVGANPSYLIDVLTTTGASRARMRLVDPFKPFTVVPLDGDGNPVPGLTNLLMPIRFTAAEEPVKAAPVQSAPVEPVADPEPAVVAVEAKPAEPVAANPAQQPVSDAGAGGPTGVLNAASVESVAVSAAAGDSTDAAGNSDLGEPPAQMAGIVWSVGMRIRLRRATKKLTRSHVGIEYLSGGLIIINSVRVDADRLTEIAGVQYALIESQVGRSLKYTYAPKRPVRVPAEVSLTVRCPASAHRFDGEPQAPFVPVTTTGTIGVHKYANGRVCGASGRALTAAAIDRLMRQHEVFAEQAASAPTALAGEGAGHAAAPARSAAEPDAAAGGDGCAIRYDQSVPHPFKQAIDDGKKPNACTRCLCGTTLRAKVHRGQGAPAAQPAAKPEPVAPTGPIWIAVLQLAARVGGQMVTEATEEGAQKAVEQFGTNRAVGVLVVEDTNGKRMYVGAWSRKDAEVMQQTACAFGIPAHTVQGEWPPQGAAAGNTQEDAKVKVQQQSPVIVDGEPKFDPARAAKEAFLKFGTGDYAGAMELIEEGLRVAPNHMFRDGNGGTYGWERIRDGIEAKQVEAEIQAEAERDALAGIAAETAAATVAVDADSPDDDVEGRAESGVVLAVDDGPATVGAEVDEEPMVQRLRAALAGQPAEVIEAAVAAAKAAVQAKTGLAAVRAKTRPAAQTRTGPVVKPSTQPAAAVREPVAVPVQRSAATQAAVAADVERWKPFGMTPPVNLSGERVFVLPVGTRVRALRTAVKETLSAAKRDGTIAQVPTIDADKSTRPFRLRVRFTEAGALTAATETVNQAVIAALPDVLPERVNA